jgi:hypothetical protein
MYGTPRNPEVMLRRLAAKIQPGKRYRSAVALPDVGNITITFEAFRPEASFVSAVMNYTGWDEDDELRPFDHKMMGKCQTELERGFVIALVRGEPSRTPDHRIRLARQLGQFPRERVLRGRALEEAVRNDREGKAVAFEREQDRWKRGITIALTSPLGILGRQQVPRFGPSECPSPWLRQQFVEAGERWRRTVVAPFAVFVDADDRLSIQTVKTLDSYREKYDIHASQLIDE